MIYALLSAFPFLLREFKNSMAFTTFVAQDSKNIKYSFNYM